jgi:hypothetical protein
MNKKKDELKDKIINLEDFFSCVADELRKETRLKRFHFLLPDDKNGDFVTRHSTCGSKIRFIKKELCFLGEDARKDIFYPKIAFRQYSFLRRILIIKFNWKIQWHGISAIMPIYSDGKIICLILFADKLPDKKPYKNTRYINHIKREITRCLEEIILYNQALERIIREHDNQNKPPVCRVSPSADEQVPALIGKQAEFL